MLVRRCGNQIDIGPSDGSPLSRTWLDHLAPELTYTKKISLHGADQWLPDGTQRRMRFDTLRLYDMDQSGRLISSLGMLPRILMVLRRNGCEPLMQDITFPVHRAEALQPVWAEMTRPEFAEWRYRQWECVMQIVNSQGGIIDACTGFGKTELIGRLCRLYPQAKIAVVAKEMDVLQTIITRLLKMVPNVGEVHGKKHDFQRVTVYSAKSLHHAEDDIDLVFGDEAHQLAADDLKTKIHYAFPLARRFALTANPNDRLDGCSTRLEYLFGPIIFHLPIDEATQAGMVTPIHVRWMNMKLTRNPMVGLSTDIGRARFGLWRNQERNQIIARTAQLHPDDQVLVAIEKFEHGIMLQKLLPDFVFVSGTPDPKIVSQLKREGHLPEDYVPIDHKKRMQYRQQFEKGTLRKAICTDVWSTGVDFRQLGVLIRGDARSTGIIDTQLPGRLTRLHEGKQVGILYDCWDCFDDKLLRRSQERSRRYAKKNWTQDRRAVSEEL